MPRNLHSRRFAVGAGCFIAFAVIFAMSMSVTYPPLVDYPNHLARYYITATVDQDPLLQQFYTKNWSWQPYLGADIAGYILSHLFEPYTVGRVLVFLSLALWLVAAVTLHRVLWGRFSLWPLVSILVLFNANLTWGLVNYLLTSALAILAFTLWAVLPKDGRSARVLVAAAIATGLYFAHLIAFGVYGLFVVLYEIGRWLRTGSRSFGSFLSVMVWSCIQFVPAMILFAFRDSPPWVSFANFGTFADRVSAFYSPTLQYDLTADRLIFAYLIILFWFGLRHGGRLVLHPDMRLPLLGGLLVTLAMPRVLLGVASLEIRLPFVLAVLLIAACRFEWHQKWERRAVIASLLAVLVVRLVLTGAAWQKHDMETRELVAAFSVMERGSRLLPIGEREGNDIENALHWHSASYAVIERQVFLPTLFTKHTVIDVKEAYQEIDIVIGGPIPETEFRRSEASGHWASVEPPSPELRDWPRNYDYLLHYYPTSDDPLIPEILEKVVNGSFFVLYKIADPDGGD